MGIGRRNEGANYGRQFWGNFFKQFLALWFRDSDFFPFRKRGSMGGADDAFVVLKMQFLPPSILERERGFRQQTKRFFKGVER